MNSRWVFGFCFFSFVLDEFGLKHKKDWKRNALKDRGRRGGGTDPRRGALRAGAGSARVVVSEAGGPGVLGGRRRGRAGVRGAPGEQSHVQGLPWEARGPRGGRRRGPRTAGGGGGQVRCAVRSVRPRRRPHARGVRPRLQGRERVAGGGVLGGDGPAPLAPHHRRRRSRWPIRRVHVRLRPREKRVRRALAQGNGEGYMLEYQQ